MVYEFEFFYESPDENKPIQKLTIVLDLSFDSEVFRDGQGLNPERRYDVEIKGLQVFDGTGTDRSKEFAHMRQDFERHFNKYERFWALQKIVDLEDIPCER